MGALAAVSAGVLFAVMFWGAVTVARRLNGGHL